MPGTGDAANKYKLVITVSFVPGTTELESILVFCATVTNYHKRNSLKQRKCITLQFSSQKPNILTGLRSRCQQGTFLSGKSRGESVSLLFQLPKATGFP